MSSGKIGFDISHKLSYISGNYTNSNSRCQNGSKLLGVKGLMALREHLTTPRNFSQFISVLICFSVFTFSAFPQLPLLTQAELAEEKCPSEKDEKNSEEELIVCSSARRRLNKRRHNHLCLPHATGKSPRQIASNANRFLAIVGHQLANGLCAPLLI